MPQPTKNIGDPQIDPAQDEWDKLVNRPDMQALDDQGGAIASEHENGGGDSSGDGLFDRAYDKASDRLDQRNDANAERRAAEKEEFDAAENAMGYRSGADKKAQEDKGGFFNRKNAGRGAIAGVSIGVMLAAFSLLTPFKLPALLQIVTDETGQRVEQITTRRAKVIMAHAILTKFGSPGGVVITGNGPVSSLIASMRTNNFEAKLKDKGIEIASYDKEGVTLKANGKFVANGAKLKSANVIYAALEEQPLTRKIITEIVKEEIPTWRWMKRAKFAGWLRIKYGITRFSTKESAETDKDKKLADVQEDRLTQAYAHYADEMSEAVGCIMGDPGCPVKSADKATVVDRLKDKASTVSATKDAIKNTVKEQARAVVSDSTKNIAAKVHTQLVKTISNKFVTKAIPIIGWIDLVATIDHIVYEIGENDYIAKIPAYYRASSFGFMYGTWAGYADQQKAGKMDNDVAGTLTSQLDGAEESQAFNYIMGDSSKGTPVKLKVDENNPSAINAGWQSFKETPAGLTYNYVTHNILSLYYHTIGGEGLLGAIGNVVGGLIAGGVQFVTPDRIELFFSEYVGKMLGKVFTMIGFAADPLDQGADLMNNVYAGGDVTYNSFCQESGCRRITDEQVATQNSAIALERNQDIQDRGWAYALLSPESPVSVTNRLAMVIPSSLSINNLNVANGAGQLASVVTSTPGRLLGTTAKADEGYVNLNGVVNYGATTADLNNPVAEGALSGDTCPEVADGEYNNCSIDKLVAEAMACNFDSKNASCDFTSAISANDGLGVMSYNILGSNHDDKDGGLSWQSRLKSVATTIAAEKPDIIGFQEVSGSDGQQVLLRSLLSDTYSMAPNSGDAEPRPIYWNTSLFSLVREGTYNYPRYDDRRDESPWVELKHNGSGKSVYVYNMHNATGDSSDSAHSTVGGINPPDQRTLSTQALIDSIKATVPSGTTTILVGDYNSTCAVTDLDSATPLDEIPCQMLIKNGFSDAGETAKSSGLPTENSEYSTSHLEVGEQRKFGRHIDHVFYSSGASVISWKNIINETTRYASDHTPVLVGLSIPGMTDIQESGGGGTGEVTASGFAWPLGETNWKNHKANHLASHYAGGGFLGGSYGNSVDISWGGTKGTHVYSMLGGTVSMQPLGRASYQCTGTPNSSNNGGMMITSEIGGQTVKIAYAHGDNLKVKQGDSVKAGQQIMDVGNVGNSCGAHLHMNVSVDNKNICPQDLFVAMNKGGTIDLFSLAAKATSTCSGRG